MESCVVREVAEESGLPLAALRRPEHLGWVGWKDLSSATHAGAMAAYCFRLDETYVWAGSRSTPEGDVAWVPAQVLSGTSGDVPVVPNIALFLPPMLQSEHPSHFMCSYDDDRLVSVDPWAGAPVDASPSGDRREMIT